MKLTSKMKIILFTAIIAIAVIVGFALINHNNHVKFQEQLDLGNEALLNLDYDAAIAAFDKAIQLDPKNVDAYLGIADAYIGLGDYEKANEYLQMGYDNTKDDRLLNKMVENYIVIGKDHLAGNRPNDAEDAFNGALEKDPDNEDALGGIEDSKNHPDYDDNQDKEPAEDNGSEGNSGSGNDSNGDSDNGNNSDSDSSGNNSSDGNSSGNDSSDSTGSNTSSGLQFDPYGFTFFGYPIHEDHYEELKAAVGYSGVDDPYSTACHAPGNGYGEMIICTQEGNHKTFSLVGEITPEEYYCAHTAWLVNEPGTGAVYTFTVCPYEAYRHVVEKNFKGPITLGSNLTEVLSLCGYTDGIPAFDETITLAPGTTLTYGESIASEFNTDTSLLINNDKFLMFFSFKDEKVEMFTIYYY